MGNLIHTAKAAIAGAITAGVTATAGSVLEHVGREHESPLALDTWQHVAIVGGVAAWTYIHSRFEA